MNNVEFFFRRATEKAASTLRLAGWEPETIAEYLTRPGHLAKLMEAARDLHFQALEYVEADVDAFAAQIVTLMTKAA